MPKPDAYPFKRIAAHFGLDYGDCLTIADASRGRDVPGEKLKAAVSRAGACIPHMSDWHNFVRVVEEANANFKLIQTGAMDWQTGEMRPIAEFDECCET